MMASRTSGQKTRTPLLCHALCIILLHLKRLAALRQMEIFFWSFGCDACAPIFCALHVNCRCPLYGSLNGSNYGSDEAKPEDPLISSGSFWGGASSRGTENLHRVYTAYDYRMRTTSTPIASAISAHARSAVTAGRPIFLASARQARSP